MTEPDRTPEQVAEFDQTHAAIAGSLDILVTGYRTMLANGEPRDLLVASQGEYLRANFTHDSLSEHLTVAVQRIAEHDAEVDRLRAALDTPSLLEVYAAEIATLRADVQRLTANLDMEARSAERWSRATLEARKQRDRHAATVERVRAMCTDLEPCDSCGRGRVGLAEEILKALTAPAQRAQDGPTDPAEGERTGEGAPDAQEAAEAPRFIIDSGGVDPIRVEVDPNGRLWLSGSDPDGGQWGWRLKRYESLAIADAICLDRRPA